MKQLRSPPSSSLSSDMTCLATGSEAVELDSKAESPETSSPFGESFNYIMPVCSPEVCSSRRWSLPDGHPECFRRGAAGAKAEFSVTKIPKGQGIAK
jgi:hypothetical protein